MAVIDLVMPKMGESITEATILKWLKQPGDTIMMDETLLEIATDKVDSEVPSTAEGVLESILFNVNDVVPVGSVIARIKTGSDETVSAPARPAVSTPAAPIFQPDYTKEKITANTSSTHTSYQPHTINSNGNRFYSPLVLNIAASEGISMTELEKLGGSGNEGRVTKKDILEYVNSRKSGAGSREARLIMSAAACDVIRSMISCLPRDLPRLRRLQDRKSVV